jgi:hypothetical protein
MMLGGRGGGVNRLVGLVNVSVPTDLTIVLQIDDPHPRKME